jgi:hypothetical protein
MADPHNKKGHTSFQEAVNLFFHRKYLSSKNLTVIVHFDGWGILILPILHGFVCGAYDPLIRT